MAKGWIEKVLEAPPWSERKLEEAARGMVNGSCDDPPEVQLEFWKNLARSKHGEGTKEYMKELHELARQARQGVFK